MHAFILLQLFSCSAVANITKEKFINIQSACYYFHSKKKKKKKKKKNTPQNTQKTKLQNPEWFFFWQKKNPGFFLTLVQVHAFGEVLIVYTDLICAVHLPWSVHGAPASAHSVFCRTDEPGIILLTLICKFYILQDFRTAFYFRFRSCTYF